MDIRQLTARLDEIEQNIPSIKKYMVESVYNSPEMMPHWRNLDEGFIKGYDRYLAEIALTPDQIQNIFKQAGGSAGAAPKDPGKLASFVDKILPTSQAASLEKSLPAPDAGPVDGFDQKAAAAVSALPADAATKQSVMQWVKQGIKNPGAQQLILTAVGAGLGSLLSKIALFGGGPVAAAITGAVVAGVISIAAAKMQGQDWKSAFKGAIKPALMGGAAAVVGNLVTTAVSGGVDAVASAVKGQGDAGVPANAGADQAEAQRLGLNPNASRDEIEQARGVLEPKFPGSGFGNGSSPPEQRGSSDYANMADAHKPEYKKAYNDYMSDPKNSYGDSPQAQSALKARADAFANQEAGGRYDSPGRSVGMQAHSDAAMKAGGVGLVQQPGSGTAINNADPSNPATMASIKGQQDYYQNTPQGQAEYAKITNPTSRVGTKNNFESAYVDKQATLNMWFIQESLGLLTSGVILKSTIKEGVMDWFKGKGKEGEAAAGGVTPEALNQAWTAAGSPTDSEEISKVLQSAGVKSDVVTKLFTDLKIPAPTGKTDPTLDAPADTAAAGADAAKPDELDDIKKNAGLPVVNIKDMLAQIMALTPEEQKQVLAYLKK